MYFKGIYGVQFFTNRTSDRDIILFHKTLYSKISFIKFGGIAPLNIAFLIPCVPVLAPLGAGSWQDIPFLQLLATICQLELFDQISVGFIFLNPYWQ